MLKQQAIRSKKLRDSARGQDCTFNVVGVCNYNPETSVLCHIDGEFKGIGLKNHDVSAAIGCSDCHAWLDQHRGSEEDRLFYSLRALVRTLVYWVNEGLIRI